MFLFFLFPSYINLVGDSININLNQINISYEKIGNGYPIILLHGWGANKNTFNKFTTPHCIAPTILDLLGVKYNANLYMVDSIFSPNYDENEIFYSYELSCFLNDKYLTEDGVNIKTTFNENANSADIFLNKVSDFIVKQAYIDRIYKSNLFEKYNFKDFCY